MTPDEALDRFLSWLPEARGDGLRPFAGAFTGPDAAVRALIKDVDGALYADTASGDALSFFGADMNVHRFEDEIDTRLRERIFGVRDVVTEPAVIGAVQDYLLSVGALPAVFLAWHSGPFFVRPDDYDVGFAVGKSRIGQPNGFVVLLDDGIGSPVVENVVDILSHKLAAGFFFVLVQIDLETP